MMSFTEELSVISVWFRGVCLAWSCTAQCIMPCKINGMHVKSANTGLSADHLAYWNISDCLDSSTKLWGPVLESPDPEQGVVEVCQTTLGFRRRL